MQTAYLYGAKPSPAEYERRCLEIAAFEAQCIEYVLDRHSVNASVDDSLCVFNRQFFGYAIDANGGKRGRVQDVINVHREIANAISKARGRRTVVRVQEIPLMFEVENPFPQALDYRESNIVVGEDRMLAGIEYDAFSGRKPLVIDFNANQHHILIGGASGAGKSVLQNMMVLSLAASTSPTRLRAMLVDLKGRDLPKYARLPHVAEIATTIDRGEEMIAGVHAEVEWRKQHYTPDLPRLVLVVDELAELRNSKDAVDQLNSILALGRGLRVNCILCTQDPTKEVLGGISTRNISVRIAGSVADADASRYVTGKAGINAHLLPLGRGAFVAVSGNEVRRFQAYLLEDEPALDKVEDLKEYWEEELGPVTLPPALHAPVTEHNHRRPAPVTVTSRNQPEPVITGVTSPADDESPRFDQDLAFLSSPVMPVMFPLGAFRPLTEAERIEVRRLATLADYQYQGQVSRNRLVVAVYGSKSPERLAEIDRALSETDTKVIRLPQRAAAR